MHLAILFHLTPLPRRTTPAVRALGTQPDAVRVRCLAALMTATRYALSTGALAKASLTVVMTQRQGLPPALSGMLSNELELVRALLADAGYPTKLIPSIAAEAAGGFIGVAKAQTAEVLYRVECDSLHGPESLANLIAAYKEREHGPDFLLTPYAAPTQTEGPSWSRILQSRRTLMFSARVLDRFNEVFCFDERRQQGTLPNAANDLTAMHRLIPCWAPKQALALPLYSDESLPPGPALDWWQLSNAALDLNAKEPGELSPMAKAGLALRHDLRSPPPC